MSRATSAVAGVAAFVAVVLLFCGGLTHAQDHGQTPTFGTRPTQEELAKFFAIQPDGATLPPGQGDVATGKSVFEQNCAMCHGTNLEGVKVTGAPALNGGRGTLTKTPLKTVESYWPYATTLFDYIKRAMPITAPGSMTDDQVYALCAYILSHGKIIPEDAVMSKDTLPKVTMPNRDGFKRYHGPDSRFYHSNPG